MKHDLILELDDSRVRALLCRRQGKANHVVLARSYTLGEGTPSALLAQVVEKVLEGQDRSDVTVLLTVSDRRFVQGMAKAAKAPTSSELPSLLQAEAQKVGMFADGDLLTIGYTELRGGKEWCAAFEASPQALVQEYVDAIHSCGLTRVRITSIESVLAAGLAKQSAPVAIADLRSDRARVIVARDGVVLASRKVRLTYMMSGFEDAAAVLAPLRSEIKRSLAFFEESGIPPATELFLLGELKDEDLADPAWQETFEIPCSRCAVPEIEALPEEIANPVTWSVVALGPSVRRARVPWLVEPVRVFEIRKVLRLVGQAVAGLVVVAGGYLSWLEYERFLQVDRVELAATRARVALVQEEIRELELRLVPPRIVADRKSIVTHLRPAVPVSRLCAAIAKGCSSDVRFTAWKLEDERLRLEGLVSASDDLAALAGFGEVDRAVASVPGVGDGAGRLLGRSGPGVRFEYSARVGRKD